MKNSTQQQYHTKWRMFAPLGLALVGCGLSILGEAIGIKTRNEAVLSWFTWGTLGLIVTNAGLVFFGEAVKCRVLLELQEK